MAKLSTQVGAVVALVSAIKNVGPKAVLRFSAGGLCVQAMSPGDAWMVDVKWRPENFAKFFWPWETNVSVDAQLLHKVLGGVKPAAVIKIRQAAHFEQHALRMDWEHGCESGNFKVGNLVPSLEGLLETTQATEVMLRLPVSEFAEAVRRVCDLCGHFFVQATPEGVWFVGACFGDATVTPRVFRAAGVRVYNGKPLQQTFGPFNAEHVVAAHVESFVSAEVNGPDVILKCAHYAPLVVCTRREFDVTLYFSPYVNEDYIPPAPPRIVVATATQPQ